MVVFDFPLELEREIFELAGESNPSMLPTLMRVCRRVSTWVKPLLYRVIVVESMPKRDATLSALELAIQLEPGLVRKAVRHLYLHNPDDTARNIGVLSACSGVTNLLLGGVFDPDLAPSLRGMQLQKLAIQPASPGLPLGPEDSMFKTLTHLDLLTEYYDEDDSDDTWERWKSLASLPALTHLCLCDVLALGILTPVLAGCPKLLVVIAVTEVKPLTENNTDPRVVRTWGEGHLHDWQLGARGGQDMWARAEMFVTQKRMGHIPETTFFLEDSAYGLTI
ncbi:hypothetical protein C8R46DRAFT_1114829 [Mycena filopes]|nr:hypothetical protein C8R46DRAFT_1114829 [Mycena filopes]